MIDDARDRLTHRITKARVGLEVRRGASPAAILAVAALLAALVGGYIVSQVSRSFMRDTFTARFAVEDATGVQASLNDIRFKGIRAGTITGVEVDETGGAVISAKVRSEWGPIYRNARAELRPNTPLKDMYLDIVDRGTADTGKLEGDTPLPRARTATSVDISQVLNVVQPPEREHLAALVDNLGHGLQDRGNQLRQTLVQVAPLLHATRRISDQVATRRRVTSRLVHNTTEITAELARRDTQLRTLVTDGAAVLGVLRAKSGQVDGVLRRLPPTLREAQRSFVAVSGVLPEIDRAVASLRPSTRRLGPALTALERVGRSGAPALNALRRPVSDLVPLAASLQPISDDLGKTLKGLLPEVPVLNRTTDNLVRCEEGVQGFFHWDASMTKYGEARGPTPRGNLVAGPMSAGWLANSPFELAPQACTDGKPITGRVPTEKDMH